MGLFHRNENDANFAGGSRNIVESIQRHRVNASNFSPFNI